MRINLGKVVRWYISGTDAGSCFDAETARGLPGLYKYPEEQQWSFDQSLPV